MSTELKKYGGAVETMLEVMLLEPDDFLKVRETLTRIGIASKADRKLYQSCHILHKQGRYFIVHFKELFALDGKTTTLSNGDIQRRDAIAKLLEDWGLVKLCRSVEINVKSVLAQTKVVSYHEKHLWELVAKYTIGNKK
ncbi:MAG: translational repressor RegA [Prevotella sp.]